WPGNAACPQDAVTRVGDDYTATLPTDYIAVTIVRFVASVQIQARPAIEFWDVSSDVPQLWFAVDEQAAPLAYPATPIFIEDTYFDGDVGVMDYAIHTLLFDPALTVPAHGVMAISVAPNFTPLGAVRWASTDEVDVGSNDDATMFVGTDTPPYGELVTDDFLGQCTDGPRDGLWCDRRNGDADCLPGGTCDDIPDVLAFEMVARVDEDPTGACCIAAEGNCSQELPWVCELQGNVFQGAGRSCDVCMLDPLNNTGCLPYCNNNPDCKICIGGDNHCDPCTATDPDCLPDGECTDFGPCVHVPPACSVHACCDDNGNCEEYTDPDPCPDGWTDLLYGSSCDPSCCEQNAPYPGGDTCIEATPTIVNVPPLGTEDPNTVVVTGDNSSATFDDWNQPICEGGSNEDGECDRDVQCTSGGTCTGACVEGGDPCTSDEDCEGVVAVCTGYECVGGNDPPGTACDPDYDCPDGACTGRPCAWSIFDPAGGTRDPGWWEAFQIDACANVRIDLCCSEIQTPLGPDVLQPAWSGMYASCPCGDYVPNSPVEEPVGHGRFTGLGYAYGSPFCSEDNVWITFGPVPKGTYYYPIYSGLGATYEVIPGEGGGGQYQLHITVAGCLPAACCANVCEGGSEEGALCNPLGIPECPNGSCQGGVCINGDLDDRPCDPVTGEVLQCAGGTCSDNTGCEVVNELVCDAVGGMWLAGENLPSPDDDPIVYCGGGTPEDPYVCATGSCCEGPGACTDEWLGSPMDEDICEGTGGPDATYVGGATCDWVPPEGPCPVCPAAYYPENCTGDEVQSGFIFEMDRKFGARVADDFVAGVTEIGEFCFSPCFLSDEGECAHFPEMGIDPPPDQIEVHFYYDDHGLPGEELPDSAALVQPIEIAAKAWWGGNFRCWDYAALFDPPIGGFEIDETYWVEFSGMGSPDPPVGTGCTLYLHGALDGNGWALRDYDHYGAREWTVEDALGFYECEDGIAEEFAFCIQGGFQPPPPMRGACCLCDGTCVDNLLWEECMGHSEFDCVNPPYATVYLDPPIGKFLPRRLCDDIVGTELECQDLGEAGGCPGELGRPGEDCVNPAVVSEGTHYFTNICSTTDGAASYPVCDNQNDLQIAADVWYEYHACDSEKRIDIDVCNVDFDAVLAIYTNGTSVCPACDDPNLNDYLEPVGCRDIDCPDEGPTSATFADAADQCFLIRIGGYNGPFGTSSTRDTRGNGELDIGCGGCYPSSGADPELIDIEGFTFEYQKIRYLSFHAGDPSGTGVGGRSQAVRVTFMDLPAPYDTWNGVQMWVQEPDPFCENAGVVSPPCPPGDTEWLGATLG
ncbi:MAG: hypothetical protein JSU86_05185, partial [Phycisphaerales bacterium]